jgi:hypothetical protein
MSPFLEQAARRGAIVSGGPVEADFTRGWGKHPFRGDCAHHWTADRRIALPDGAYGLFSTCGITTVATEQVPLLGAGTFEYCRRCESILMRALMGPLRPKI